MASCRRYYFGCRCRNPLSRITGRNREGLKRFGEHEKNKEWTAFRRSDKKSVDSNGWGSDRCFTFSHQFFFRRVDIIR
jgi:hypothetical protein